MSRMSLCITGSHRAQPAAAFPSLSSCLTDVATAKSPFARLAAREETWGEGAAAPSVLMPTGCWWERGCSLRIYISICSPPIREMSA